MLLGSQLGMLSDPAEQSVCFKLLACRQVGMCDIEAPVCFALIDLQNIHFAMSMLHHMTATHMCSTRHRPPCNPLLKHVCQWQQLAYTPWQLLLLPSALLAPLSVPHQPTCRVPLQHWQCYHTTAPETLPCWTAPAACTCMVGASCWIKQASKPCSSCIQMGEQLLRQFCTCPAPFAVAVARQQLSYIQVIPYVHGNLRRVLQC